jgi:hypothetical protein
MIKVYSLLGFVQHEGTDLLGVFASAEGVMQYVESRNGRWYYDEMGYVESELGHPIEDVEGVVEYVEFQRRSSVTLSYKG